MKVAELRKVLASRKKEEIVKLAVEFYKLVPKAKKEDYGLDAMIMNPEVKKKTGAKKAGQSLAEIEIDLKEFLGNAREQYYLIPNKIVPKKDRPKWRFLVKRWYKELINTKRKDANLEKQSELLTDLYNLICESCGYQYFSGYDSFQSIGIEQTDFFKSVLELMQEAKGKTALVEKGPGLIVDNYLNRYTLYSGLMVELIHFLDIPDLKEKAIEKAEKMIKLNGFDFNKKEEKRSWYDSTKEFKKEEKHNNLTEFVYRLYCGLFEMEKGVQFFKDHYYYRDEEIKLYILIELLFENGKKDRIKAELENAIENGVQLRNKLVNLLNEIKSNDQLPKYIR